MTFPAPDPNTFAYERGSQGFLISGATTTVAQVGTARPVGANQYGVVADSAFGQQPFNVTVQVDINLSAGTGSFSALLVSLLGSLDGLNFYPITQFSAPTGGIFPSLGIGGARYISATIDTATVSSGTPQATVSFTMGG